MTSMAGFVDEAQLHVRGGDGGAGAVSFRREAHVPRGGPDGGDGGDGGAVWLVADRNVASLLAFRDHPHRRAGDGTHGQGKRRHGRAGQDLLVPVPEGTVVRSRDGAVLADLVRHGNRWEAARGGQGGRGNARFLSNRRRAPAFAEQGEQGEEGWLNLELKLMADVALIGFPNVGKSTLISRISAARPRIADYPFTTLEPHLGVVRLGDPGGPGGVEFVVADVPGLIEGASEGKGLGHRFLRHVERARVLCVLLDAAPTAERPPDQQEGVLLRELGRYRPELLDRPRVVVRSRVDLAAADSGPVDAALPIYEDRPAISAVTGQGIDALVGRLAELVAKARAAEPEPDTFVVHRPAAAGVRVERVDAHTWAVSGRPAERAVALNDVTGPDAAAFVAHRLKRAGVDRALSRAGVAEGDTVTIGAFAFEYRAD